MKPIAQVMRRRSGVVVAVGTAASLLVLGAGSAGAATLQPAPSPAPLPALAAVPQGIGSAALQGARVVGQTAAQARETVSFVLAPRNLGILVRNVNARMPGGRLTVGQFAGRFGQTPAHITALTRFLARHHIASHVHGDRLDVTTTGRVADYNAALGVRQQNFALAAVPPTAGLAGRPAMTIHGTTGAARLPRALASYVTAVLGLTNYPAAVSHAVHAPVLAQASRAAAPRTAAPQAVGGFAGNLTPASFVNRYNLRPLESKGFRGQGQTIGIIALASMNPADATHFWAKVLKLRTKARRLRISTVDGGAGPVKANNSSAESTLDVEQSGAVAPAASMIVYQAPNSDAGYIDAFVTAASQNRAGVVSSSWGQSEDVIASGVASRTQSRAYARAFDVVFLEMAAQGQSAFVAAGDNGAYDSSGSQECVFAGCTQSKNLSVDYPGSSPWITSAGGMTLPGTISLGGGVTTSVPAARAWGYDYLWRMYKAFGASSESSFARSMVGGTGGGYSALEQTPRYQNQFLDVHHFSAVQYLRPLRSSARTEHGFTRPTKWAFTANPAVTRGSRNGRAVPDVAADADPFTGYEIYFSKFAGAKIETRWGGTSFVAPQLAGAAAVLNSYVHRRVGFWNPVIYRLASRAGSPFRPNETAGPNNDNLYYSGTPGKRYSPAVGLGAPNFARLAAELKR